MPLEMRRTSADIVTWMEELIGKFDILPSKIKGIVHDNGSNMVAAVLCTGHTLQLIVNSALKDPSVSKAISAARNLVEHFREK